MATRRWLPIIIVLTVFAGTACWPFGDSGQSEMTVRREGGRVEILRGDQTIVVGESDESLEPQDVVVTRGTGSATLVLEGDRVVRLARRSEARVISTADIDSRRGSLLAEARAPMRVRFDDVEASMSDARFRLDHGFGSIRAASYDGRVELAAPGEPRVVLTRLFEVDVAAGDLPDRKTPYHLDEKDAWDLRYLDDVVDLTRELDLLASGFSRQLGRSRPRLDYFSSLAPRADVSFVKRYLSRPPADLLVGFTIAINSDADLRNAFNAAFRYHDEGARWGVTASILDVRTDPLIADLEDLILGTQVLASSGADGAADFTLASAEGPSGGDGSGDGTAVTDPPVDGNNDDGGNNDDDGKNDDDGGGDDDEKDCEDFANCTVEDVRDKLPPPEPEESPLDVLNDAGLGGK